MFPRNHGTGCVLSSVLLLGSCIQETARGALCTGRSSAGAGSVILPGDCQTAAAGSCIEKDCKLLVLCGLLECLLLLHLHLSPERCPG